MLTWMRRLWPAGTVVAVALLAPGVAAAAPGEPAVSTGRATEIAQQLATVTGSVDPNGRPTTYYFEVGLTRAYGSATPESAAGTGDRPVAVRSPVGNLAPYTTYHYRLVARNARGVARGEDRTFRTRRQPLGVTLGATVNPVGPGNATVINGSLSGTFNAGRQVVLQANPFPFQGFVTVADVHLTGPTGGFSFPVLGVPVNTQYRVVLPERPAVASPIVTVGVAVRVSVHVKVRRTRGRRPLVRFSGAVRPAHDGALMAIQRLGRGGTWTTVRATVARARRGDSSRYVREFRLRRGGTFRVLANIGDGDHVPASSLSVRVRRRG